MDQQWVDFCQKLNVWQNWESHWKSNQNNIFLQLIFFPQKSTFYMEDWQWCGSTCWSLEYPSWLDQNLAAADCQAAGRAWDLSYACLPAVVRCRLPPGLQAPPAGLTGPPWRQVCWRRCTLLDWIGFSFVWDAYVRSRSLLATSFWIPRSSSSLLECGGAVFPDALHWTPLAWNRALLVLPAPQWYEVIDQWPVGDVW